MVKKKFDFELAYYKYRKIRRTEEKIVEIYDTDKIKSPVHLSIGQESIAVGCSLATSKDDVINEFDFNVKPRGIPALYNALE